MNTGSVAFGKMRQNSGSLVSETQLMFGERSQRRIKNIVPRVKHSDGTIMLWECLRASETMNIIKVE